MATPLEEVLSRLPIKGGSQTGGTTAQASFLPILNADGQLDPSFFEETILNSVFEPANQAARLALVAKIGDVAIQQDTKVAYILAATPAATNGNWKVIGTSDASLASSIGFDPSATSLAATTVQTALVELWTKALLTDTARTETATVTFNVAGSAPFAIGVGSRGQRVIGLLADQLWDSTAGQTGGHDGAWYRNAANLTGYISHDRIAVDDTYPINITGRAAEAATALYADNAGTAVNADNATEAGHALEADHADDADLATQATTLHDGISTYRSGSYYLNASNLNAGYLNPARFDDASHGQRAGQVGGTPLHSAATTTTAGFLSASDKTKLDGIEVSADVNQNAFSTINLLSGNLVSQVPTDVLTIRSDSPELVITSDQNTRTMTLALDMGNLTHGSLDALDADDHAQYVHIANARTITAQHLFNPTSPSTPAFRLGVNARNALIPYLNAEQLGGYASSYYLDISHMTGILSHDRILNGDTYPINITGTAAGSLPIEGGEITGDLLVNFLTVGSLVGTGIRFVYADPTGALYADGTITTDDLLEGIVNKYATRKSIGEVLEATLADSATLTWQMTGVGGNTPSISALVTVTTDDVTEALNTTNLYLTQAHLDTLLEVGSTIVKTLANGHVHIEANAISAGTAGQIANKLVLRDADGDFTANDITIHDITAHNATVTNLLDPAVEPPEDPETDPLKGRLADKAYVDVRTRHTYDKAIYDVPEGLTTGTPPVELATTVKDGTVSGANFGELLKLATLVESKAAAPIFCPPLRLTEPLIGTGVDVTNNYLNPNWKKYDCRSLQTRGRVDNNYFLVLRIRGWIKQQHRWALRYFTYENDVNTEHTLMLSSFVDDQDMPQHNWIDYNLSFEYTYIDQTVNLVVAGKSNITLEFTEYSGVFVGPAQYRFPGIAPFDQLYNGGFVQIEGEGVWGMTPDQPFNPYTPDLLQLQLEGEIVTGGQTYYPVDPNDTRIYDGEEVLDTQDAYQVYTRAAGSDENGFPVYTKGDNREDPADTVVYEKQRNRCNYTVFNKLSGFSGFLRGNTSITSGPGLTPMLGGAILAAGVPTSYDILLTSNKLSEDITFVNNQFPIWDYDEDNSYIADVTDVTTLAGLVKAIDLVNGVTCTYDHLTDRMTIVLPIPSGEAGTEKPKPPLYHSPTGDTAGLNTLRVTFGAGGTQADCWTGVSLPGVCGIRTTDLIPNVNFATPVVIHSNVPGQFAVDDHSYTYGPTDTLQALITRVSAQVNLAYNADANEFVLSKMPGTTTDAESIVPPRVYDVIGNLMTAMGLEKESHGNADFPIESVHSLLYLENKGVVVGGNFRNYCGATSAGLAKIRFDGKADPMFNIGAGFDNAIFSIADGADNGESIFVAGLDPVAFKGQNKKPLYRLDAYGNELLIPGTSNPVTDVDVVNVSGDNQNRVLGVLPFSSGDFAVLTPRKLTIYTNNGEVKKTGNTPHVYTATKGLHGMVKYREEGADTYFLLASAAYTTPTIGQAFNSKAEPLGLRLLKYNAASGAIAEDSAWNSAPYWDGNEWTFGAGTGAEASCAYPVVGGIGANGDLGDPYVICGNRGTYFGTERTQDYAEGIWTAWNERGTGNLFLQSDILKAPDTDPWPWIIEGGSIAEPLTEGQGAGNRTYTELVSNVGDAGEVGYVYQDYNAQWVYFNQSGNVQPNTGGIAYRLMIDIQKDTGKGTGTDVNDYVFPYFALNFGSFVVSCLVNTQDKRIAVMIPPDKLAGSPGITVGASATCTELNSDTWRITITAQDNNTPSMTVKGLVYPAFNSDQNGTGAPVGGSNPNICSRNLRVFGMCLQYQAWNADWVTTHENRILPSDVNNSNGLNFRGLYKVGLEGNKRGRAWDGFSTYMTLSEGQAHAIPFGTDKDDNIYVGGPITGISDGTNLIPVTPWRLYKLDETGKFIKEFPFNDIVTCCVVTPHSQLIVGGRFTCYNKRAVNKFAFLDLDGNVLDDISIPNEEIIVSATEPPVTGEYSINKDKMWMDISVEPPVVMVYDDGLVKGWVNLLQASHRVSAPIITADNPIDPQKIWIEVPDFTIKNADWTDDKDVKVTWRKNSLNAVGQIYNPDPVDGGIVLNEAGTYVIYARAETPEGDWSHSRDVSATFVVRNQADAPSINTTAVDAFWSVAIQSAYPNGVIHYKVVPDGTAPDQVAYTTVPGPTTNQITFTVTRTGTVYAYVTEPTLRNSIVVSQDIEVMLGDASIDLTLNNTDPIAVLTPTNNGSESALLYSFGPTDAQCPEPTSANYNDPNGPVLHLSTAAFVTLHLLDHAGFSTGTSMVIKCKSVTVDNTNKITAEQEDSTYTTVYRLDKPTFVPGSSVVIGGDGVVKFEGAYRAAYHGAYQETYSDQVYTIPSTVGGLATFRLTTGGYAWPVNAYVRILAESSFDYIEGIVTEYVSGSNGSVTVQVTKVVGAGHQHNLWTVTTLDTNGDMVLYDFTNTTLGTPAYDAAYSAPDWYVDVDNNGNSNHVPPNSFSLRARAVVGPRVNAAADKVPSALTIVPQFNWKRQAATGTPVNDSKYGVIGYQLNPVLPDEALHHIKYSFNTQPESIKRNTDPADTTGTLYVRGSTISLDNVEQFITDDELHIYVREWDEADDPSLDTFTDIVVMRMSVAFPYRHLLSAADADAVMHEPNDPQSPNANVLTYNTNYTPLLYVDSGIAGTNGVTTRVTYNNNTLITHLTEVDYEFTSNGSTTPGFTPAYSVIANGLLNLRMRFFQSGLMPSRVVTIAEIGMAMPPVSFDPPTGTNLGREGFVKLNCAIPTAIIRYTVDGLNPDELSLIYPPDNSHLWLQNDGSTQYEGIRIRANATIKALAENTNPNWVLHTYTSATYAVNAPAWSIVALPDPQFITKNQPSVWTDQMNWIIDHKDQYNIKFVTTLGDNVDLYSDQDQWDTATAAMHMLNGIIPWNVVCGNHDMNSTIDSSAFVANFTAASIYANWPAGDYGYMPGPIPKSHYSWARQTINGEKWLYLNIRYGALTGTLDSTMQGRIDFYKNAILANPEASIVIFTHSYIGDDNVLTTEGTDIWNRLINHSELTDAKWFAVLCGHMHSTTGAGRITQTVNGRDIYVMQSDYQAWPTQGATETDQKGWMRIITFEPANSLVRVTTWSPEYEVGGIEYTDAMPDPTLHKFTLPHYFECYDRGFEEVGYGLVNLKCGTPFYETKDPEYIAANFLDKVLIDVNANGEVIQGGQVSSDEAKSYIWRWKGKGIVGLSDNDIWNVVKPAQGQYWLSPVDSRGAGNANEVLQVRKYWGVTDATRYFGSTGTGNNVTNITSPPAYPGALPVTGLENTGLSTNVGNDGILLHVRGLKPGKYMMVAYGHKTRFDLEMLHGECISQSETGGANKSAAFYDYDTPFFNITKDLPDIPLYQQAVMPIRMFRIKGFKKVATYNWDPVDSDTCMHWGVSYIGTNVVPLSWYNEIQSRTTVSTFKNQTFFDIASVTAGGAYTKVTEQGVIMLPRLSNDGYEGLHNNSTGTVGTPLTTPGITIPASAGTNTLAENANVKAYTDSSGEVNCWMDLIAFAPATYVPGTEAIHPPNAYNEVPVGNYYVCQSKIHPDPFAISRLLLCQDYTTPIEGAYTILYPYALNAPSLQNIVWEMSWAGGYAYSNPAWLSPQADWAAGAIVYATGSQGIGPG